MRHLLFLLLLITLTACPQKDDDVINCTEVYVYGLNVTVTDANTNEIILEGITVLAEDDDVVEMLELGYESYIGAGERVGNYTIVVSGDGYMSQTVGPIEVLADECHVIPQNIEIVLVPN